MAEVLGALIITGVCATILTAMAICFAGIRWCVKQIINGGSDNK